MTDLEAELDRALREQRCVWEGGESAVDCQLVVSVSRHTADSYTFSFSPGPHRLPTARRSMTGPRSRSKLQTTSSLTHRDILFAVSPSTRGGGRGDGAKWVLLAGRPSGGCEDVAETTDVADRWVRSTLGMRTFNECERVICRLAAMVGESPAPELGPLTPIVGIIDCGDSFTGVGVGEGEGEGDGGRHGLAAAEYGLLGPASTDRSGQRLDALADRGGDA